MLDCRRTSPLLPSLHSSSKAASLPCHARKGRQNLSTQSRSLLREVIGTSAAVILLSAGASHAADLSPAQVFSQSCAGCHAGGGNIVQRGAGLTLEELQKNDAASPEQIYNLIYSGKGKMPGYGTNCTPRGKCTFAARLKDDQIKDLTSYVLEQASSGWKK